MREKPILHFESRGVTGNIYWILGKVRDIMRKERRIAAFNDMWDEVQRCDSYEESLQVIGQQVHLIDDDTGKEYDGA